MGAAGASQRSFFGLLPTGGCNGRGAPARTLAVPPPPLTVSAPSTTKNHSRQTHWRPPPKPPLPTPTPLSPLYHQIGDLGVAKALTRAHYAQTQIGTPLYMAPEVWRGLPYGPSCDLWSLGCMAYELMAYR